MFYEILTCAKRGRPASPQRHFHPVVQRFAAHLLAGAPLEGSEALKPELSRRYLRCFVIKLEISVDRS